MSFWEKLEKLRTEKGISQRAVEDALGFSNGSYSKWKHCKPTMYRMSKLASYFDVPIDYFIKDDDMKIVSRDSLNPEKDLSEQKKRLYEYYYLLNDEKRLQFLEILRKLAEDFPEIQLIVDSRNQKF